MNKKLLTTSHPLPATRYQLTVGWLYPELMNTYGDRGNIITLQKRCEWRNIDVKINYLDFGFRISDLKACDMLFMGGAQDKQQKIVASDFTKEKTKVLKEVIEDGVPGLYICGAYQFLGKYYKEADGTVIDCLNIIDFYTENPGENATRLIGNIVVDPSNVILNAPPRSGKYSWGEMKNLNINNQKEKSFDFAQDNNSKTVIGFENHGGRTYLGKDIEPLGKVLVGFGNNGEDKQEGMFYKNSIGTYLHGPILPKNPHLADYLIKVALEKKYKKTIELSSLDDSLEWRAHKAIAMKLGIEI